MNTPEGSVTISSAITTSVWATCRLWCQEVPQGRAEPRPHRSQGAPPAELSLPDLAPAARAVREPTTHQTQLLRNPGEVASAPARKHGSAEGRR